MDFDAQRLDEWKNIDRNAYLYHYKQWESQKQSTLHFNALLQDIIQPGSTVVDLGCGAGAATSYIAKNNPEPKFVGIDFSEDLTSIANKLACENKVNNVRFDTGNWFNLSKKTSVDGVISLQTLSWLPEFEAPLIQVFEKFNPRWMALTSLFYEGDISCTIEVNEHIRNRKSFYNVYSIPALSRLAASYNHKVNSANRYVIAIDIEKPSDTNFMGTYTKLESKADKEDYERIQISGPLLMNWYELLIVKCLAWLPLRLIADDLVSVYPF